MFWSSNREDGLREAERRGGEELERFLLVNFLFLASYISIITFSIAIFSWFNFSSKITIFIIHSVYAFAVLRTIYRILTNLKNILLFITCKFNVRNYIEKKIYYEVKRETESKTNHWLYKMFGTKNNEEIARHISVRATDGIIRKYKFVILWFVFIFIVYTTGFKFVISNIFGVDTGNLNFIQDFFYPFIASIKYFLSFF